MRESNFRTISLAESAANRGFAAVPAFDR